MCSKRDRSENRTHLKFVMEFTNVFTLVAKRTSNVRNGTRT